VFEAQAEPVRWAICIDGNDSSNRLKQNRQLLFCYQMSPSVLEAQAECVRWARCNNSSRNRLKYILKLLCGVPHLSLVTEPCFFPGSSLLIQIANAPKPSASSSCTSTSQLFPPLLMPFAACFGKYFAFCSFF